MTQTRSFVPQTIRHELLLTAITPVSHHDASVQDDSNRNLFNRQAILVPEAQRDLPPVTTEQANALAARCPVPAALVPLLSDMSFPEFLATVLVRTFMDEFNSREGQGLFSGMQRYTMLENRVPHAAYTDSLRRFYSRLADLMQVNVPRMKGDEDLMHLLAAPRAAQLAALQVLRNQGHDIVRLARFWHSTRKEEIGAYLKAVKGQKAAAASLSDLDPELVQEVLGGEDVDDVRELLLERGYDPDELFTRIAAAYGVERTEAATILTFTEDQLDSNVGRTRKLEIPHITANSIRHQMLREPAMRHLFAAIGVEPESLPPGVEAIFYNGGNIKSGTPQPSNPALLSRQIRETFPSLDLLGGVTNTNDLGESLVGVYSLLVCRETRHLLPEWARELPATEVSAFDLLEDSTLTRQALGRGEGTPKDRGQMIFGFENLVAGTQFLVWLDFKSYASTLSRGAAVAAIEQWQQAPTLGGASARGYGQMKVEDWRRPDPEGDAAARAEYEAYLESHADGLREQLISGKLGTNAVVVN